jgi:murein tripeptide amidase MpaA
MPRRSLFIAIASGLASSIALAGDLDGHKAVRVHIDTQAQFDTVLDLTDDVWSHHIGIGGDLDVRLSPDAYRTLLDLGIQHEVLIDDVGAAVRAERLAIQQRNLLAGLGFYDNYHPEDEMRAYVEDLVATYPGLASMQVIGTSIEGRDIWEVTITGPGDPTDRPEIALNSTQHAREWASPMTVTYVIEQLLESYDVDPEVTAILDSVEFHIVPIVNPDGYVFSWADPDNRLWRKNRNPNGGGCVGVDLNRNWELAWGGEGSDGDPCGTTYRGTSPFSEPETAALASYYASLPNLKAHIDFHTYGKWILSPWSYQSELPPDATLFDALNTDLQQAIYDVHQEVYIAGPGYTTLYPAAGVAPDYVYGTLGAWSWTIELRPKSGNPGFLLPPDEILPTAEENFPAVLALAENVLLPLRIIGSLDELPSYLRTGEPEPFSVEVYEILGTIGDEGVRLLARNDPDDEFVASDMTLAGGHAYEGLIPADECGTTVEFFVQVVTGAGETVTFPEGGADAPLTLGVFDADTLLEDDCEQNIGWTVGDAGDDANTGIWELGDPEKTDAQPGDDHTPDGVNCWVTGANANGGLGGNDVDGGVTTLTSPLFSALSNAGDTYVSYWRWYSNDQGNNPNADSMPVSISNDDGQSWTLLEDVDDNANAWVNVAFRVADFVEPTDQMRLRFVARDIDGPSLVEAAIDDVLVEAIGCACPTGADFNGDGDLSILDFVAYQAAWQNGDPCADLNGDGDLNILDFVAFQALFQGG